MLLENGATLLLENGEPLVAEDYAAPSLGVTPAHEIWILTD